MKYTKEEARVKKQALTSLQVRAIPPVVKTTGISPTMSMKTVILYTVVLMDLILITGALQLQLTVTALV